MYRGIWNNTVNLACLYVVCDLCALELQQFDEKAYFPKVDFSIIIHSRNMVSSGLNFSAALLNICHTSYLHPACYSYKYLVDWLTYSSFQNMFSKHGFTFYVMVFVGNIMCYWDRLIFQHFLSKIHTFQNQFYHNKYFLAIYEARDSNNVLKERERENERMKLPLLFYGRSDFNYYIFYSSHA